MSYKIGLIQNLIGKVDSLLIGGGMSFTFLKSMGYEVGRSLLEKDKVELAGQLLKHAKKSGVDIVLPEDVVVTTELKQGATTVSIDNIPEDMMGVDIGREVAGKICTDYKKGQDNSLERPP